MQTEDSQARKNDPDGTRENVIEVATREFVESGFSGARVNRSRPTKTSKRMIYYYFGSKEGLYLAVLERAYQKIHSSIPPSTSVPAGSGDAYFGRQHI